MKTNFIHNIGDTVIFINDNGVNWGERKIISRENTCYGLAYHISPTDTPWYAIPERNLHKN